LTVRASAPPEVVFAVIADARHWKDWSYIRRSFLEREGQPAPDGVGAVRRFGGGPFLTKEEVVAFDPPRHLSYVMRAGMPVRGYRADVDVTPDGDGARIDWRASFERTVPGTDRLMTAVLRVSVGRIARAAAKEAERRASGQPAAPRTKSS
jgi:uncharacterized protein YndB with AHSA1/START domain